jgi:8-oxo-dGTP diphosphatase
MESSLATVPNLVARPQLAVIAVPFRLGVEGLTVGHQAHDASGALLISAHPGPEESLDEAAQRLIQRAVGRTSQYVEQLYTLDTERDATREVTVSYLALFRQDPWETGADPRLRWTPVGDIDLEDQVHRMVFDYALVRLKAKFGYTNIAFHLLPEQFTLSELQQTYEQVLGHPVDKRNFRRRMTASNILVKTSAMRRDGSHRPAALYQFAARDDQAAYLTPSWAAASLSPPGGGQDDEIE